MLHAPEDGFLAEHLRGILNGRGEGEEVGAKYLEVVKVWVVFPLRYRPIDIGSAIGTSKDTFFRDGDVGFLHMGSLFRLHGRRGRKIRASVKTNSASRDK